MHNLESNLYSSKMNFPFESLKVVEFHLNKTIEELSKHGLQCEYNVEVSDKPDKLFNLVVYILKEKKQ
jgi:hypothetical protein